MAKEPVTLVGQHLKNTAVRLKAIGKEIENGITEAQLLEVGRVLKEQAEELLKVGQVYEQALEYSPSPLIPHTTPFDLAAEHAKIKAANDATVRQALVDPNEKALSGTPNVAITDADGNLVDVGVSTVGEGEPAA
jgi:hypothetical protein